jgi:hypothetical protein
MMCNVSYVVWRYSMLNELIDSREERRVKAVGSSWSSGLPVSKVQGKEPSMMLGCKKWLHSVMPTIKNGSPHSKSKCPSTISTSFNSRCKFEWLSIFMHWNIGQYRVLTNSISSMLLKCQIEHSSSSHTNASSTSVWANDSLDLYLTSPYLFTLRYENLLYFISYIQSILSKTVSYTLVNQIMCSTTLHRPLCEHLVNRRVGRGTHLSKGSSMTATAF